MIDAKHGGFQSADWTEAAYRLTRAGHDFVIATILGSAGSAPRGPGSKMVITGEQIFGSVGGGHLEFSVTQKARELLSRPQEAPVIEHYPLGASLGQCCGGSVSVLLELQHSRQPSIELYGAGHVAHELIAILSRLPIRVRWIDSRPELFPDKVADNIQWVLDEDPVEQVRAAMPGSYFLIMTHNHQLDFSLCEQILKRNDSAMLGVIGSQTKAERFRMRLTHKQHAQAAIDHLTCPIGISEVSGKLPMEIAVSVAGDLIRRYQASQSDKTVRHGLQWRELKHSITALQEQELP